MLAKIALVFSAYGIFSVVGAYQVIQYLENGSVPKIVTIFTLIIKFILGVPGYLNITIDPFVNIDGGFYYIEPESKVSWFQAFESCRRMNAYLIAFETMEEWNLINQYLWNHNISDLYWTSGVDLAIEGKHGWFSIGEPIQLNIWGSGEPNNMDGVEHCDELGYDGNSTNYKVLNDIQCDEQRLFICETHEPKTASVVVF
ncbi:uncharacterized protein Dana_GF27940 [Drosophila ananassae]|uniref:C-type lectin domain-containing protein n=1 Tax=Drosophila ananassae TaxID=7217 RepID=A0A0P8XHE2_DROAN|nr:uncharacterized protein Dana_GF27940 [Drosophila ananassae]